VWDCPIALATAYLNVGGPVVEPPKQEGSGSPVRGKEGRSDTVRSARCTLGRV